MKLENKK